jgi:hypothetical protein
MSVHIVFIPLNRRCIRICCEIFKYNKNDLLFSVGLKVSAKGFEPLTVPIGIGMLYPV